MLRELSSFEFVCDECGEKSQVVFDTSKHHVKLPLGWSRWKTKSIDGGYYTTEFVCEYCPVCTTKKKERRAVRKAKEAKTK